MKTAISFTVLILVSGVIFYGVSIFFEDSKTSRSKLHSEVFALDDGFGYAITYEGKTLIRQKSIPAIEETKPFCSRNDASKIADLVYTEVERQQSTYGLKGRIDEIRNPYELFSTIKMMKSILIDTDVSTLECVASYLCRIEDVEVTGKFTNALNAIPLLNENGADLVFSAVEMPFLNGIELFKKTNCSSQFIFYGRGYYISYGDFSIERLRLFGQTYLLQQPFECRIKGPKQLWERSSRFYQHYFRWSQKYERKA